MFSELNHARLWLPHSYINISRQLDNKYYCPRKKVTHVKKHCDLGWCEEMAPHTLLLPLHRRSPPPAPSSPPVEVASPSPLLARSCPLLVASPRLPLWSSVGVVSRIPATGPIHPLSGHHRRIRPLHCQIYCAYQFTVPCHYPRHLRVGGCKWQSPRNLDHRASRPSPLLGPVFSHWPQVVVA
jgi:hypothetical protein